MSDSYIISKGTIGNMLAFWQKDGGYRESLDNAKQFSLQEAQDAIKGREKEFKIHSVMDCYACSELCVNTQNIW